MSDINPAIAVLLLILVVSTLGGRLLIAGKPAEKPVKVMMFVAYFWLLAFVQLTVCALAYFIWQHFLKQTL